MKHHIAVKFAAILLCACALLAAVFSGIGIAVAAEARLYESTPEEQAAQFRQGTMLLLSNQIAARYASEYLGETPAFLLEDWDDIFQRSCWNPDSIFYTIKSTSGNLLKSNYRNLPDAESFTFTVQTTYTAVVAVVPVDAYPSASTTSPTQPWHLVETIPAEVDYDFIRAGYDPKTETLSNFYLEYQDTPEFEVTLHLLPGAYIQDGSETLLRVLWKYRYTMCVIFAAALLLIGIFSVYLCCAAGKKPGGEEIVPSGLNRLPIDLYAVIAGGASIAAACAAVYLFRYAYENSFLPVALIAVAFLGFFVCLFVVGFCYCLICQGKAGGAYLWRHSLVGRVLLFCLRVCRKCLRVLWRFVSGIIRRLPLIWQWLLTTFVMVLMILFGMAWGNVFLLMWIVAICFGIVLYGAYAFGSLLAGAQKMSHGDLTVRIHDRLLLGSFRDFADCLNALAGVTAAAAQNQMKSERMKVELITNVSHDIKTPLTSIINYVDLLQKEPSEEDARQYLEVLSRQSLRLKKLIDDLIEMSKASTGNLPTAIARVDAGEAIHQALGEFSDKLAAARLTPVFTAPADPVFILADGRLVWRVLSNLLSNAVKYAMPGTRLYIDLVALEGQTLLSLKNISREPLNISADELLERFVRGEASRNTEGSGLGLNIAQSLMELQHGKLQLLVDGDLFKVTLLFPNAPK